MITTAELLTSCEIGLIYSIVALGIYFTFRIIDFPDLTCDGSFVCGAAVTATAIKYGIHPFMALILATGAGACAGSITAFLYTYGTVNNLLSGILTTCMLYSINLKIMGGVPNIALLHEPTIFSYGAELFILVTIAGLLWIFTSLLLSTDYGLGVRSIGRNPHLASAYGIRIPLFTSTILILSNAFIGLGGGLFCQHQGFADISQGIGTIVVGLAAVIIGEKFLSPRSVWIAPLACILGSLAYRFIITLALHSEWLGLQSYDLNLVTGIIIVLVMWLPFTKKQEHSPC